MGCLILNILKLLNILNLTFSKSSSNQTIMDQLAAVQRPMGIFEQYMASSTQALVLKEKVFSLSQDSFDVTNISGEPILKIEGRHMTISGRKTVRDMAGSTSLTLSRRRCTCTRHM